MKKFITAASNSRSADYRSARRRGLARLSALVPAAVLACAALPAHAALTFTTIFDPSFDPAAIPTINNVLAGYSSLFSDNVNVSLRFKYSGSGLGSTGTYSFAVPYQDYYNALVTDGTSAADATALAGLAPGGPSNPVNGTSTIVQGRVGLAAVGIPIDTSGILGYLDGDIDLNLGLMNYNRITIDPAKYDLQAVAQHEINEVLGTISNVGSANPRPVDLFRYDSAGNRTFTTAGDDAYFSINGTTQLARYNQDPGGDYGDFYSVFGGQVPQVQDAFATPGAIPNLNVELTILDVVGFDRITPQAVPEPGGAALVLTALLGCVVAVRRRRS